MRKSAPETGTGIACASWCTGRREHAIEGVVLTFINIDAQKEAQEELKQMSEKKLTAARRFAENIVDTVRESLLVLDRRLRVVTANRSFYDTFATTPEKTEGKKLFALGSRQWDIPELRELLDQVVEQKQSFQNLYGRASLPEDRGKAHAVECPPAAGSREGRRPHPSGRRGCHRPCRLRPERNKRERRTPSREPFRDCGKKPRSF